ncbi:kinesin k39, partial [Cystoisospora suis]
ACFINRSLSALVAVVRELAKRGGAKARREEEDQEEEEEEENERDGGRRYAQGPPSSTYPSSSSLSCSFSSSSSFSFSEAAVDEEEKKSETEATAHVENKPRSGPGEKEKNNEIEEKKKEKQTKPDDSTLPLDPFSETGSFSSFSNASRRLSIPLNTSSLSPSSSSSHLKKSTDVFDLSLLSSRREDFKGLSFSSTPSPSCSSQVSPKVSIPRIRDSKLTFLLRDALDGRSKLILIATVNPLSVEYHSSLSTLQFTQKAKYI